MNITDLATAAQRATASIRAIQEAPSSMVGTVTIGLSPELRDRVNFNMRWRRASNRVRELRERLEAYSKRRWF